MSQSKASVLLKYFEFSKKKEEELNDLKLLFSFANGKFESTGKSDLQMKQIIFRGVTTSIVLGTITYLIPELALQSGMKFYDPEFGSEGWFIGQEFVLDLIVVRFQQFAFPIFMESSKAKTFFWRPFLEKNVELPCEFLKDEKDLRTENETYKNKIKSCEEEIKNLKKGLETEIKKNLNQSLSKLTLELFPSDDEDEYLDLRPDRSFEKEEEDWPGDRTDLDKDDDEEIEPEKKGEFDDFIDNGEKKSLRDFMVQRNLFNKRANKYQSFPVFIRKQKHYRRDFSSRKKIKRN